MAIVHCTLESTQRRELMYFQFATVFDITSDAAVISIPIILLRASRIPTRQKLIIGTLLCLSVVVILTSVFRMAFFTLPNGNIDEPWAWVWHFAEPAVGIMMVSITAFRTLFIVPHRGQDFSPPRSISSQRRWFGALRFMSPEGWSSSRWTAWSPWPRRGSPRPESARSPRSWRFPWKNSQTTSGWTSKGTPALDSASFNAPILPGPPMNTRNRNSYRRAWWRLSLPELPGPTIRGLGLTRPGSSSSSRSGSRSHSSPAVSAMAEAKQPRSDGWSMSAPGTPPSPLSECDGRTRAQDCDVERGLTALPVAASRYPEMRERSWSPPPLERTEPARLPRRAPQIEPTMRTQFPRPEAPWD